MSHCQLAGPDLRHLFSTMTKISYAGYRFPPKVIQKAIWLYVKFTLSFRDVEDLLAERGIAVSYETVRRWVNHFGHKIGHGHMAFDHCCSMSTIVNEIIRVYRSTT